MQVHLGEGELRHFAELKPDSMRGETGGFGRDRLSEYAWYALRIDVHMCSSLHSTLKVTCTYLLWGNKSHPCNNPTSLAGSESKCLLNVEGI